MAYNFSKLVVVVVCFITFCFAWSEAELEEQIFGEQAIDRFSCDNTATLPITWTSPLGACGLDGNLYFNALKNSTLASYFQCLIKNIGKPTPNVGINYPGSCGCPNFCSNATSAGTCINSSCYCEIGWAGPDCSQVSPDNICNGVGTVKSISGFNTCECSTGYSLTDCSATTGELPPITQVVEPENQYTDKDDYRNNNPIFNSSTIAQIRLTMPPSYLTYMLEPANTDTDTYLPVEMWYYNGPTLQTLDKVGFRIKGFSSRKYVKKTFKLSFNKFEDGRKWAQQKKLSLKAMEQDVSAIKEVLCLGLLYSMNAPAQRYGYTQLFINDQSMGSYLMLENVDDQFLDSRFGNDKGAFYKCLGTLEYLGDDPELYRNSTRFGSTSYSPESDAAEDFSLLRDFIKILNITDDSEFINKLPDIFDVDLFVRVLSVEVMTGNWDGIWNANNYFLYYNTDLEKFQYFRHDVELSFGTWDTFYHMATKPIYTWGDGGSGYRLINRVLAHEPFRGMFTKYCKDLIEIYFKLGGEFENRMVYLNQEIRPLIKQDQWRFTDFGYSYEQFIDLPDKAMTLETGEPMSDTYPVVHTWGMKEFMTVRIQSALLQLE